MYGFSGTQVEVERDIETVLIPDGVTSSLNKGAIVYLQQVLGGMFTVQTDNGYLMRIDGRDADAIGQPIPEDRRQVSEEDVHAKGIKAVVIEQLRTCYDPEIPINIVDLGLIYEIEMGEHMEGAGIPVRIEMTLTAPGCGMGEILKNDIEKKIQEIPGVGDVVVDLVFDPPWESGLMTEAAKLQLGFL